MHLICQDNHYVLNILTEPTSLLIIMPNLSPVYQYYRDNFENIIDYRDKNICTDNGNPTALLNTSY